MTTSHDPTVLVTGATGTVGGFAVEALAGYDCAVRALVRTPSEYDGPGEAVAFDFTKPVTWGAALKGGDSLFVVRPPHIGRVGRDITPAIDAAVRCGVDHVVVLSVLGAERNPLLPHRRIEKHVEAADCTDTFLRASFFMQNFGEVHREDIRNRDELFVPAGGGETSFVDARDVGAVAAAALVEPGHENVAYDLTGPEALTYDEAAAVFSDVLGREITYPRPGAVRFLRRLVSRGDPLPFALVQLGVYTTARLGLAGRVTDDVRRVLGREPRSLADYLADARDTFEPATDAGGGVARVAH
jgi:uncharacterized protein YbjT (DUF2867 family)